MSGDKPFHFIHLAIQVAKNGSLDIGQSTTDIITSAEEKKISNMLLFHQLFIILLFNEFREFRVERRFNTSTHESISMVAEIIIY